MPQETQSRSSDKIYSVSDLNTWADQVLSGGIGEVWVRGEVSGLKTQASGHVYFSLKDAGGVLSVAMFRGAASKSTVKLVEGKQILVFGSVGIYAARGSFQMVAKFVLDEGAGRLQQEFERLKKQLECEGLFAKENKIAIPVLPQTVAFITSPTGAVWQDFTRILARREWRGRVILFPCAVQGVDAPKELVASLKKADEFPEVELIVVGRGGGSIEDLWSFNDEQVVRAVASMKRPIISAVGHETDFTLCDFASDFRAETPSAAAELIAGHFNDARASVEDFARQLMRVVGHALMIAKERLEGLLERLMGRSPRVILDRGAQRLDELEERLRLGTRGKLAEVKGRLATLSAQINGLNPEVTLKRGYAMVKGKDGKLITRAAMAKTGEEIEVTWADGEKQARTL